MSNLSFPDLSVSQRRERIAAVLAVGLQRVFDHLADWLGRRATWSLAGSRVITEAPACQTGASCLFWVYQNRLNRCTTKLTVRVIVSTSKGAPLGSSLMSTRKTGDQTASRASALPTLGCTYGVFPTRISPLFPVPMLLWATS
jgi:hypothetical protein